MIKFAIIFCTIYLYDSAYTRGQSGVYNELVFSQSFSITDFFHLYIHYPYVNRTAKEFKNFLEGYRTILKQQKWIVRGLWAFNKNDMLKLCVDSSGNRLSFDTYSLNEDFKTVLNASWPSLMINASQENHWFVEYYIRGCCVTENAVSYFQQAVDLLDTYNAAIRLKDLKPGNDYELSHVIKVATSAFGKKVLVRCVKSQETQQQYLFEILICFNTKNELQDCQHRLSKNDGYRCTSDKPVNYPLLPEGYY